MVVLGCCGNPVVTWCPCGGVRTGPCAARVDGGVTVSQLVVYDFVHHGGVLYGGGNVPQFGNEIM
jgi:hypothetical protein